MTYSSDDIEKLRQRLQQLKDLYDFQMEIGENTSVSEQKIKELESILKHHSE